MLVNELRMNEGNVGIMMLCNREDLCTTVVSTGRLKEGGGFDQ